MSALRGWRRWAMKLVQHASQVLPGARSCWAEAMRRELDYIEDDRTALRWALGCVLASYKARLAALSGFSTRDILWHALTSGALMLVIGFALLGNAESQTEPPRPAVAEAACDTPDAGSDIDKTSPSGLSWDAGHPARVPDPVPETSRTDRNAPVRVPPPPLCPLPLAGEGGEGHTDV